MEFSNNDKKLTDAEIIKALECCVKEEYSCKDCPYECDKHFNKKTITFDTMPNGMSYDQLSCDEWLKIDALDLINRQKVEIERLGKELGLVSILYQEEQEENKEIKAEAYKEFAERLKDMSEHFWEEKENFVSEEQIDNLLKELVGE